ACRDELESVLEDWILLGLRFGDQIPVLAGIDLNVSRKPLEVY
ncbi:MAG: type II toxin-antitoxin system HicB family antitoxin, partial [Meiothermus sp.]